MTAGAAGFAVGLGLTNDCNLACAHCYRDTERIDHLSLSDVRRVANHLPIRAVNLGTGENALHPEAWRLRARSIAVVLVPDPPTEARVRAEILKLDLERPPGCSVVVRESSVAVE